MPLRANTKADFDARFIPEPMSGCWLWEGGYSESTGYGAFSLNGARHAHRAAWLLYRGPIPDGLCVLHRCDNPACVNPGHLFLGTYSDNMKDCVSKGRFHLHVPIYHGEQHPQAKLTWNAVQYVRASIDSTASLARQLGVSESAIRDVRKGRAWKEHPVEGAAA